MKKPSLNEKDILNPQEAIECFGLSARKFRSYISNSSNLPFIALYGTRKLILRAEFEKFLMQNPDIKEKLKNGTTR